jgi:hypothetical protein
MGNCSDPSFKDKKITSLLPFGDAKTKAGEFISTILRKKDNHFIVASVANDVDTYLLVDSSGKSQPLVVDKTKSSESVCHFLEYEKYIISFNYKGKFTITENGTRVFESSESFRGKYSFGHNINYSRSVSLVGANLFFLDTSCDLIEYDLATLLAAKDKSQIRGKKVADGELEDFCIRGDKAIFTVTAEGKFGHVGPGNKVLKSIEVDPVTRGTQFTAIESLGTTIVSCGFSPNKNKKHYFLLNQDLKEISYCQVNAIHGGVHNMIISEKDKHHHILASNAFITVDWLVVAHNVITWIDSMEVTKFEIYGLIWMVPGEQALVYGEKGLLSSFKL